MSSEENQSLYDFESVIDLPPELMHAFEPTGMVKRIIDIIYESPIPLNMTQIRAVYYRKHKELLKINSARQCMTKVNKSSKVYKPDKTHWARKDVETD